MKKAVYVESSVISYLGALPSRDVVTAARQTLTHQWWNSSRQKFELFVSVLVRREITSGDPVAAQRRLDYIEGIQLLAASPEAQSVADALVSGGALPEKAKEDALHIGIAAAQGVDYLLTWNFRHINNAQQKADIVKIVESFEFGCPMLCSPEELGAYS